MNRHPLSENFGDMPDDEFAVLVDDIKKHGLREHGWVYEGQILDGWHRYTACEAAGVAFRYEIYKGSDPAGFVISINDRRRHRTASQRAASVVACRAWRKPGEKSMGAAAAPMTATVAEMAKEAGVSERTIQQAKAAHDAGLGEAVRDGAMSAEEAAAAARGAAERPAKPKTDPRDKRIAALEEEVEELKTHISVIEEQSKDAVLAAQVADELLNTDAAKALIAAKEEIHRLERLRDSLQNENGALVRQVKALQRKLDRVAA